MINEEQVIWFFENMKKMGSIPEISEYFNFYNRNDKICIQYTVNVRTSSYTVPKESILKLLRDWKLKKILD